MLNKERRVVITGMGTISPLGVGIDKNWRGLCSGKSGVRLISRFDTNNYRTKIGGEVLEFAPEDFMERKTARRTSRFIQFAVASSRMALEDSEIMINSDNEDRIGVSIATALAGVDSFEKNYRMLLESERSRVSPFFITGYLANMAAGEVALHFGAKGPSLCSVTACAAGSNGIGEAFRVIQLGEADVMLAGGTEAGITESIFAGLDAIRAMSTRNDNPSKASRPFEKDRDGFVFGEGCGVLMLEELHHAQRRGAKIYAELLGYGHSCDAYHITSPDTNGKGAAASMRMALKDSGLSASDIDNVNAHGTSTQLNDMVETRAIKQVFEAHSKELTVTSNKSMIGHLWGAAGAVEAIFSTMTIYHGVIPPTINYETPDPECDLNYITNVARNFDVNTVMSNSFGFGGVNASLVFRKFKS